MNLSRRHFLATSSAWVASSSLGWMRPESPDHRTISIIHTTDLHGHVLPTLSYSGKARIGGFARCATQIRRWRKENPHSLLVDVGDLYQGTAASYNNRGRLFIDLLGNFEYDAWVLGNHDFDWGPEVLEANVAASKASILTGNLKRGDKVAGQFDGEFGKILPWKMCETGGFKIALVGQITPGLPYWLTPETLGGFLPTDPAEALKKAINQAKAAKADAIVVLGHYGHKKADDFGNPTKETLRHAPGADAFIGGHTHVHVPTSDIEGVLYTQASYFGIHCGKLDLTFDINSRQLIAKTAETEFMGDDIDFDPSVINLAEPALKKSEEQLARVLTTLPAPIKGKGRGSDLANFICKALAEALERHKTPVDAIFHGTFGTPELAAGPVTVADAWTLLPYENILVTASLTPAQLLEILAEDRRTSSDRTLWPFEVIEEKRVPTRILRNGEELPADEKLTVAFNSYDTQSAGQSLMRLREIVHLPDTNRRLIDVNTRDALIEGLLRS